MYQRNLRLDVVISNLSVKFDELILGCVQLSGN